jgi:hypothetical protein
MNMPTESCPTCGGTEREMIAGQGSDNLIEVPCHDCSDRPWYIAQCGYCFALVDRGDFDKHKDWHRRHGDEVKPDVQ